MAEMVVCSVCGDPNCDADRYDDNGYDDYYEVCWWCQDGGERDMLGVWIDCEECGGVGEI